MKKVLISLMLALMLVVPLSVGCATGGARWQDNVPQIKHDVYTLTKIATRITLTEAKFEVEDAEAIGGYLVALQDLLSVPGTPDFTGARALVKELPRKYWMYGETIIDLLARSVASANLDITKDQELIIELIVAGIQGAREALDEFVSVSG